ncbi:MAG: CDP-archaeol synthase [bacterium]
MEYLQLIYIALPCFVANMMPVFFNRLKLLLGLKKPLDNGLKIFNKRLFGDNKTVRGLVVGIIGALIVSLIQYWLWRWNFVEFNILSSLNQFLLYGFLAGFGAIAGDAVESIIKRQLSIKSGDPLIVFDQIDYVVGFLLLTSFVISWNMNQIMFLLLFSLIAHPISNIIAYIFKIKKTYW